MNTIITRFAPSPTGNLHIGGIRTALINYILTLQAKEKFSDSKFLLRIEDTDIKRSKKEFIDNIINGLNWIGIKWDGEIYIQSKKITRHQEVAKELLKNNKVFKCICSQNQLEKKRQKNLKENKSIKRLCERCEFDHKIQQSKSGYCIRMKIPNKGNIYLKDLIQGEIIIKNEEIDNFIILRNDGTPTYMLSVVVDDHDMNVNMVVRGNDHLNNTFKQNYIYKHLNWEVPQYAHLPLLHGQDGSKLSKRHGSVDINEFKNIGYLPKAIINNLILLGWSPKKDSEMIELSEIIEKFDIKSLSKSSSIFDYNKLDFLNNFYHQKNENYEYFLKYLNKENITIKYTKINRDKIDKIYLAYKTKIKKLSDYIEIIKIYCDEKFIYKPNVILDDRFKNILNKFVKNLKNINDWDETNLENCLRDFINKEKINFPVFGKPMRYLLTNNQNGISIALIMLILGKDETYSRINNYIKNN